MAGGGFGLVLQDRIEFRLSGYQSTRAVRDPDGNDQTGEGTVGVGGKIRLGDFKEDRASIALHIVAMSAERMRFDVQDERMSALDIALPLEVYIAHGQFVDHRWGVYVGPRVVFQGLESRTEIGLAT